jgi:hypothetical protein
MILFLSTKTQTKVTEKKICVDRNNKIHLLSGLEEEHEVWQLLILMHSLHSLTSYRSTSFCTSRRLLLEATNTAKRTNSYVQCLRKQSATAEAGDPELELTAFKLTEWSGVTEASIKLLERAACSSK